MDKNDTLIYQRPHYYRGQLLDENDFREGFKYHTDAQQRHNKKLHGWGVVRGLEVTRKPPNSITINSGYAIENSGQEVFLEESKEVDLPESGPNEVLRVSIKYKEAGDSERREASQQKRFNVYARISVSSGREDSSGVTLAMVTLDGEGKLADDGIDYSRTQYVKRGSITSDDLHEGLKTGWLRMPFRPLPTVEWQLKQAGVPLKQEGVPPFRVADTTALSWDEKTAGEKDRGAEGTMAIPVPPGVTKVMRLRIAGEENQGEILLKLYKAGWDEKYKKNYKETIVDKKITSPGPYLETFDVKAEKSSIDTEFHTLSLELRGTKRTSVSLIAVEFVYY